MGGACAIEVHTWPDGVGLCAGGGGDAHLLLDVDQPTLFLPLADNHAQPVEAGVAVFGHWCLPDADDAGNPQAEVYEVADSLDHGLDCRRFAPAGRRGRALPQGSASPLRVRLDHLRLRAMIEPKPLIVPAGNVQVAPRVTLPAAD